MKTSSIYNQFGQISYVFELLGTESIIKGNPCYQAIFKEFLNSLELDYSATAAALPLYKPRASFGHGNVPKETTQAPP